MSKTSLLNSTNIIRISCVAILIASLPCSATDSLPKQGPFFRIVNISPLGTGKLDVFCGEQPLAKQTKPGFFVGYTPTSAKPSQGFSLRQDGKVLDTARLPDPGTGNFFTILVKSEGNESKLEVIDDSPAYKIQESTGEKIPLKRLRVFSGSYNIPFRIDAADMGTWASRTGRESINAEKISESTNANSVKVTYIDVHGLPVELYYPVDFSIHANNSVFVTHRGSKRLRVAAFPDAIEPPSEEQEIVE